MYKVISVIVSLPYGIAGQTFQGGQNQDYSIEWFKRDELTGELTGFTSDEAADLRNFIDKNCLETFKSTVFTKTEDNEIPYESIYLMPDNEIPKYYPFEDLIKFRIINTNPFEFDILGYNRFLESK
jgi:hypothetical protein